jgi:hypothetical protein
MNHDRSIAERLKIGLGVLTMIILTLSCNLPLDNLRSGSTEENLETDLAAAGILTVEEISISPELVVVEYARLPEEDLELMVNGWLEAFTAAYEAAPEAAFYMLRTSFDGEPFLEIGSDALDLQGLISGELSPDLFLERLEITDLRPLEKRLMGNLLDLGLDVREVRLDRQVLTVEYFPAPAADQAALMEEWWLIFTTAIQENPEVDVVQIRAQALDTSAFLVVGQTADLEAYLAGELTAFQFLAGLEIREEPVELED